MQSKKTKKKTKKGNRIIFWKLLRKIYYKNKFFNKYLFMTALEEVIHNQVPPMSETNILTE
jgi:hypothetical protein